MTIEQAEHIYLDLLKADQEQQELTRRDGRTLPTWESYSSLWRSPQAVQALRVLAEDRMQQLRFILS